MDWNLNNPYLGQLREMSLADAAARTSGARRAAMFDDPYNAGFAGLSSLISGQSDAARTIGEGRLGWLKSIMDVNNQMRLMDYQAKLRKKAAGNPLLGALGNVAGTALGSWMAPGGWFAGQGTLSLKDILGD